MDRYLGYLWILFLAGQFYGIVVGVQVGIDDKCGKYCLKSFLNKDAETKSCQQGCRLYSILQFTDKNKIARNDASPQYNATAISASCVQQCNDAYKIVSLKDACRSGCEHQTPFLSGDVRVEMDDSSPFFPFAAKLIENTVNGMDDIRARMMKMAKNWLGDTPAHSLTDENDMDMENGFDDFFDRAESKFDDMVRKMESDSDSFMNSIETQDKETTASTVNPLYAYARDLMRPTASDITRPNVKPTKADPIIMVDVVSTIDLDDKDDYDDLIVPKQRPYTQQTLNGKPHEPSPPLSSNEETYADADDTWMSCLARRTQRLSLMTRWLLCMAMMLSVVCIVYGILIMMRMNQRRRMYMQNKLNKSDKTDAVYLMPPPMYQKLDVPPGQPTKGNTMPPPTYENAVNAKAENV